MAAYVFAEVEITDPVAYENYRQQVPAVIAKYGGRYLVRGGVAKLREGKTPPQRLVILEFPDMAKLEAFYNSAEYAPLLAIRSRASNSRLISIEGLPAA
jgi:uncharacterized protein (DUF1330 family)